MATNLMMVCSAFICVTSAAIYVPAVAAQQKADVEVAFTPGEDIPAIILKHIGEAKKSVRVQAFLFTDRRIVNALLAARKRGVEVALIGDKTQHDAGKVKYLDALKRAGANVYLNGNFASSHNKVIIVDGRADGATVITGSYNFTNSAQTKNAENLVVISGNATLTDRFVDNFEKHLAQSSPWQ
jgi:phosphatidylserine/phosphatidylglycerophosphate/cardiolipin synthase-like enzyme